MLSTRLCNPCDAEAVDTGIIAQTVCLTKWDTQEPQVAVFIFLSPMSGTLTES